MRTLNKRLGKLRESLEHHPLDASLSDDEFFSSTLQVLSSRGVLLFHQPDCRDRSRSITRDRVHQTTRFRYSLENRKTQASQTTKQFENCGHRIKRHSIPSNPTASSRPR